MEPEVAARFEKIEAILHEMAVRGRAAERRMDRSEKRMEKFDHRMEAAEKRMEAAEKRSEAADRRMDKFEHQLQTTRKLVEAGVKIVLQLGKSHRELEKSQKAFLDSLRKGGNGNGRRRF